jgi:adenylate cyclase
VGRDDGRPGATDGSRGRWGVARYQTPTAAGGRGRGAVQLIDTIADKHIWAERYDRDVEHVFAVQSEIAETVAGAISPAVDHEEQRRAIRKPNSLSAWETYQRGLWHFYKLTPPENLQARQLFAAASTIDPGFASPHAGIARTYLFDCLYYVAVRSTMEAARLAEEEALRAIAIDPDDSAAQWALASALLISGNHHAALDRVARALALDRNSTGAYRVRASALMLMGRYSDSRADALTSLRLNPRDPLGAVAIGLIAASHYQEGDYETTVEIVRRRSPQFTDFALPRRYLVAALGQLGRNEEAAAALAELQARWPDLSDSVARFRPPYVRPEDYEHMLDGLRKAGWQG